VTAPFDAVLAGAYPLVAPPAVAAPAVDPTFSVLVPAYQCANLIGSTLESILAQTLPPCEVIVCDDGSTDGTADVAESFGSRVTVLRNEHAGSAAARNACLAHATGTHVVGVDADDLVLPGLLAAYADALRLRPDLQIVTCDAYLETDGVIFDRYYRRTARFHVTDQRLAALHQHFIFSFASVLRTTAVEIGGWDVRLHAGMDTDFFARLVLAGATAGLVWEPLAVYRMRSGSLSDDHARSMREMVTILEHALGRESLSVDERAAASADLEIKRRLTTIAELRQALAGAGDVRHRSLAVTRSSSGRRKALAYATAAFPRTARLAYRATRRTGGSGLASRTRS
jgi:glycosyltransferase involved in cell wall biosynthesis